MTLTIRPNPTSPTAMAVINAKPSAPMASPLVSTTPTDGFVRLAPVTFGSASTPEPVPPFRLAPDVTTQMELQELASTHGYESVSQMWHDYYDTMQERYGHANYLVQASSHYSAHFTPPVAKKWIERHIVKDHQLFPDSPKKTAFACKIDSLRKAFPGLPPNVVAQSIQALAPVTGYQLKNTDLLKCSSRQLGALGILYWELEPTAAHNGNSKTADLFDRLEQIHNEVLFPQLSADRPANEQNGFFDFQQGGMGNCYALSAMYNVLNNPNTRPAVLAAFSGDASQNTVGYNTRLTHDFKTPLDLPIRVPANEVQQGLNELSRTITTLCQAPDDAPVDDSIGWKVRSAVGPLGIRILERVFATFQTESLKAKIHTLDTDPDRIQNFDKPGFRKMLGRQLAGLEEDSIFTRHAGHPEYVLKYLFNAYPDSLPDIYSKAGHKAEDVRAAEVARSTGNDTAYIGMLYQDLVRLLTAENKASNLLAMNAGSYSRTNDAKDTHFPQQHYVAECDGLGIIPSHAYAMKDYDPDAQTITWVDPHDSARKHITLSYQDSARLFAKLSMTKMNAVKA